MVRSAKISISVPGDLLRDVERMRSESRETRSDFFRRAAESLLREDREREAVERYVQGYLANPEFETEVAWAKVGEAQLAEREW